MSLELEEEPLVSAAEPDCKVWTDGGFAVDQLCVVTDDVAAIHDGTNVKFVFLKTGKSRVLTPPGGRGVGALAGRDDLAVLAWSDLGPNPGVHVFQYTAPADLRSMKGDTPLEYVSMALNQKDLLVALSGVPDFKLTLWNWETEETICSVETGLTSIEAQLSFSPDLSSGSSKTIMLSAPSEGISLWKVKRCGQQRRMLTEPIANVAAQGMMCRRHKAATWHGGGGGQQQQQAGTVYVVDGASELYKYDVGKAILTKIQVSGSYLKEGKNVQVKAHFEGLVVFTDRIMAMLEIQDDVSRELQVVNLDQALVGGVVEFTSTFSYLSWTAKGNLFLMQTTEIAVASKFVWENDFSPVYLDLTLVQPDGIVVAAITDRGLLKVFDIIGKDETLKMFLNAIPTFVVSLPRCPVLVVGTTCGSLLAVALRLSHQEIEEVYEDLEDNVISETRTETLVRAETNICKVLGVHSRPLRLAVREEERGDSLLVAADDGYLFLVDMSEEADDGGDADEAGEFLKVRGSMKLEGDISDASFRNGVALCLICSGEEEQVRPNLRTGRQICHIRVQQDERQLSVVQILHLKDPCCGILLDVRLGCFYSFLCKKKAVGKYILSEQGSSARMTPLSKMKTSHQLGLHSMQLLRGEDKGEDSVILTIGRDGLVNLCPVAFQGTIKKKQLFHYQRGGVVKVELQQTGPLTFYAVDASGSFAIFEVKSEEESEEQEEATAAATALIRERAPPSPEKPFVKRLMERDPQAGRVSVLSPTQEEEKAKLAEAQTWSEMKEAADLKADRKMHEKEIAEIEDSLKSIREEVVTLLALNEELPEEERLDRTEFELNVEEKQKRQSRGQEQEAGLHLELRAWQVARRRAGLKIRKEVWDDLEVRGRAIQGLSKNLIVRNYPLLAVTRGEAEELAMAQAEWKMGLDFDSVCAQMQQDASVLQQELATTPRAGGASNSMRGGTSFSSRQNSRDHSVSPRGPPLSSRSRSSDHRSSTEAATTVKRDVRFAGSLSHKFVGTEGTRQLEQKEVTTRLQIMQQMILLKSVVRKLKLSFNEEFDKMYAYKDEVLGQIQEWISLYSAEKERREQAEEEEKAGGTGGEELKHEAEQFRWSAVENPELDLPTRPVKQKDEKTDAQETKSAGATTAAVGGGGGQVGGGRGRDSESLAPDFMAKKSVDFTPAEISAADEFRLQAERSSRFVLHKSRGGRNDRVSLERRIDDAVEEYDRRLTELYSTRLGVEKCVLTEELKMRLLDRKMSDMEDLELEEKRLNNELANAKEKLVLAENEQQDGKAALAAMKEQLVALHDADKAMEKNFKKEFPSLNYNQLEALQRSYKRRPNAGESQQESAVDIFAKRDLKRKNLATTLGTKKSTKDLRAKSIASTLERMSNMFLGTALTKQPGAGGGASGQSQENKVTYTIDELDRPSNCPESVDLDSWNLMCSLRRQKIESEERIAQLVSELTETEEAVIDREETAAKTSRGLLEARDQLAAWKKEKNRMINNVELVLTVTRGQLEVPTSDTSPEVPGAVLLTENVISKLNHEIERLGESKLAAMTESKEFRAGTRMLQWEKDKLSMELRDLQAKWTDIQQTKLSKESRQALQSRAPSALVRPITDDYAHLDKSSRSSDAYLAQRSKELDETLEELDAAIAAKDEESKKLEEELVELEAELEAEREEVALREKRLKEIEGSTQGVTRAMQRNKLQQKIQEQHELILSLQDQLDTYIFRSFPSLG